MADSTMSDADKIRAKRLAKLGGGASSPSPASPAANGSPSQPSPAPADLSAMDLQGEQKSSIPVQPESNPFSQLGLQKEQTDDKKTSPQIKVRPAASSVKRPNDSPKSETPRPRSKTREPESLEVWQDRNLRAILRATLQPDVTRDVHGHPLIFLEGVRHDLLEENQPLLLKVTDKLDTAITEAASKAPAGKPFEYLLGCFKRVSKGLRNGRFDGDVEAKKDILREAQRMCMSYCVFAVTMPVLFSEESAESSANPLVDHLLQDPECDTGICTDFLEQASTRIDEDEDMKNVLVGAAEELSRRLAQQDMNGEYRNHVVGLNNLVRFKPIAVAITQSDLWAPPDVAPQDIEKQTLLGPFFRLSPMQIEVARSYFSAPKTRDRAFITNAQNAIRMTLRTHQLELFRLADTIVRAGPAARERMLDWFALCLNKNHKRRAMRVDYKTVASDGFMLNVTNILDQLCDPFMDAQFGKIEKIDVDYLRRNPRVDIADETKINADQKTSDAFYANKAEGSSNFISEIFFLTVAAHHYGTESAQEHVQMLRKSVKRYEQDLVAMEKERSKYENDPRYLARFEQQLELYKRMIDDTHSTIHATYGVLLDDLSQSRSMQFMRYVIVWLLRLASGQNLPKEKLKLPLPETQPDVFRCLPEYFLEDIVDNFKFITSNLPQIITPQQSEELIQVCITFLRNTEHVKNPGVKSGLVTILFYGTYQTPYHANGILGDLLIGSPFAHKHLLHALMRFYIEAESTGTHTQFYDKFNIRFEIFQVIKKIWINTTYRENLSKEASVNTQFFVQFVNMIINDVTFVLDESLTAFNKIHDLTKLINSSEFQAMSEEERKEKQELLEDQKGKAKSYMGLTRESMETLILFTEALPDAFTMPAVVKRLAAMLDHNLNIMVGDKRKDIRIENPQEYKFDPKTLLTDIIQVYLNLSEKQNFIQGIVEDGRSYRQSNFTEAGSIMKTKSFTVAPEMLRTWSDFSARVEKAALALAAEEEDLGEPPDEFLDPLMATLMLDPVILPSSKQVVDRSTIESHLLSDPTDPFNRMPLKIEEVLPDQEMKDKIEAWKSETLAAKRAEKEGKAEAMDTSAG